MSSFTTAVGGGNGVLTWYGMPGCICALEVAGCRLNELELVGGASGAFGPTCLLGAEFSSSQIIRIVMGHDLPGLISRHQTYLGYAWRRLLASRSKRQANAALGLFNADGLGRVVEAIVPGGRWPRKFWTTAINPAGQQFVFTIDGVFRNDGGHYHQISSGPGSLGAALQATCAVPELVQSIACAKVVGNGKWLLDPSGNSWINPSDGPFLDGAFSLDGACPAGIPVRMFGADPARMIACMPDGPVAWLLRNVYLLTRRLGSGWPYFEYIHLPKFPVGLLLTPIVHAVGPLSIWLTWRQKLAAILSGFETTMRALKAKGMDTPNEGECHAARVKICELCRLSPAAGPLPR